MKSELKTTEQHTQKSKLQQRYESLLADVELSKLLREKLQHDLQQIIPRINKEIRPLFKQRTDAIRTRLLRLDELADELGMDKSSTKWFAIYVADEAMAILRESDFKDEEMAYIFQKYTGKKPINEKESHDEIIEQREQKEAQELEDFDPNKVQKISKQNQLIAQDAKAIYVRLVKKFHPDLEQNETFKIQKTALVQEITAAYKAKDFLKLLSLQIEHIDEKETEGQLLADDMLKRYNKTLTKQLNQIKAEIASIKRSSQGLLENFFDRNNKFSEKQFRTTKKQLKLEIATVEQDTRNSFRYDKDWFKEWIREINDFNPN